MGGGYRQTQDSSRSVVNKTFKMICKMLYKYDYMYN